MKPIIVASLLAVALASCGSPSEQDVLTDEKIRASESAPELPEIQLSDNPEPPPAPPAPEQPVVNELENAVGNELIEAGVPGTIPPAFQDRWGMVAADCRQGEIVGTGMQITAEEIILAASSGVLQGVLGDYPERFAGRFAFDDGESREELVLTGSSNTLIRTSNGQRLVYKRCGAGRPTG